MTQTLTVTATEANRNFSSLLRQVEGGMRIVITSHGRDVALIVSPQIDKDERARRRNALAEMQVRWATAPSVTVGPWTREELYERD